jgi:hypothetical protein
LLGPGAGGGVVPALAEFDLAGGVVLGAALEQVGVFGPAAVVAAAVGAGGGAVGGGLRGVPSAHRMVPRPPLATAGPNDCRRPSARRTSSIHRVPPPWWRPTGKYSKRQLPAGMT